MGRADRMDSTADKKEQIDWVAQQTGKADRH